MTQVEYADIDPSRIPEHMGQRIGEVGRRSFLKFREELHSDPALMAEFTEGKDAYLREKEAKRE